MSWLLTIWDKPLAAWTLADLIRVGLIALFLRFLWAWANKSWR